MELPLQPPPTPHMVELDESCVARFRDTIATKGVPLSKSSAATWARCPARWSFTVVEGLSEAMGGYYPLLGMACHEVVAKFISGDLEAASALSGALSGAGVNPAMLPAATEWVQWAVDLVRQRHGRVIAVEQRVRASHIDGVTLTGRFDLVLAEGVVAPLELLDWSFGTHPKHESAEAMAADVGTTIYRVLLASSEPALPEHVAITDVHVPSGKVLSVQLTKEEVLRTWRDIRKIRDGIRSVAEDGWVEARPGQPCHGCPYQWRCPYSPAAVGQSADARDRQSALRRI